MEDEKRVTVLHEAAAAAAAAAASICPPRLEDAGLEDCALPPESIMEAFARAAISVRPRIDEDGDDDGAEESPDEYSASPAVEAVVGGGGEGELASDGLLVLGGKVPDSVGKERKEHKEVEEEASSC